MISQYDQYFHFVFNEVVRDKLVNFIHENTENVVIFAGGKFRENVGKTFHVRVIFMIFHLFP